MTLRLRHLLTLLLFALLLCTGSYGQNLQAKTDSIDKIVSNIRLDTLVKTTKADSSQLNKLTFLTDHIELGYRNNRLVKVTSVITHPPFRQIDYYFDNGQLALVRFHQETYCTSKLYYFDNDKLIKVMTKECNRYKDRNDREKGMGYLKEAEEFLDVFK